jgi:hypothetical protein
LQSPPIRPHVARVSKFFSGCSISEYREHDLEHHSEAGEVDVVTHNLGVTTPKLEMAIRQKYSPPITANDPAKEPGP